MPEGNPAAAAGSKIKLKEEESSGRMKGMQRRQQKSVEPLSGMRLGIFA
jgi:hypothetical protein